MGKLTANTSMKSFLLAFAASGAVVSGQTCRNAKYDLLFPAGSRNVQSWFRSQQTVGCDFSDCTPLFTNRASCNRVGIAYDPGMADTSQPDFSFAIGNSLPRSQFHAKVYQPIVDQCGAHKMNVVNVGSMSAMSKAQSFQAGDVVIYIANQLGSVSSSICNDLTNRGVIVLPVYVGKSTSISQLSALAKSQFSGHAAKAMSTGGFSFGHAGLILSGYDSAVSVTGAAATHKAKAIVMFSRVMAQCPGSCVSKCSFKEAHKYVIQYPAVNVKGDQGQCGPRGIIGQMGPPGPNCPGQGPPGTPGRPGLIGDPGPQGPPGNSAVCVDPTFIQTPPTGDQGAVGGIGLPGLKGPMGVHGDHGARGAKGLQGEKGPQGAQGSPGGPGAPGSQGLPGPPGFPGQPGHPGAAGFGMLTSSTIHRGAQVPLFDRVLLEILKEDENSNSGIWKQVWNIYKPPQKYNLEMANCAKEGGQ